MELSSIWEGVVASLVAACIVGLVSVSIRPPLRSRIRETFEWMFRPISELSSGLNGFWREGLQTVRVTKPQSFGSFDYGFGSVTWRRVGQALVYLACLVALVYAEFELGRFRMDALLGLPGADGPQPSLGEEGALVLVAAGIVWATFVLDVFDADPFSAVNNPDLGEVDDADTPSPRMGKRFVQGFAVLGLVATLMLAVASFVFGQIRADDLRIAEIEQQNIAATEEHRQATEQSRILACRFEGRQDCDQLTATSSAPQLQEVPERSGPGQLGTQVLLGISLWGAVAIAGTGLVPALSLVAYVLYRLIRGLLFPLLLASFLLDMVLRLVGGIVTFAGHTGHTVFQVSHRLGELEVQAAKGVANAGSAVVGRLRERPAAPEPTERNGVHQPGLSANSNGHEPETPELVDLVGGHPPQ